jgi:hypothetical protein
MNTVVRSFHPLLSELIWYAFVYILCVLCYFRSKVTVTAPTNPGQNSLPPQANNTQPLSSAQVTLSTAVRGAGGQEAGLFVLWTLFCFI